MAIALNGNEQVRSSGDGRKVLSDEEMSKRSRMENGVWIRTEAAASVIL
ncbi:hypothetical protein [Dubosiella newyorkensis]